MMGHGLEASNQIQLVEKLVQRGFLNTKNFSVIDAFKSIDRAKYLPSNTQNIYSNRPQPLCSTSQSSMSTPQLHAQVLSLLSPRLEKGRTACEIGCGTGYLPAIFEAAGCDQVLAIESNLSLFQQARENLSIIHTTIDGLREYAIDALYIAPYLESHQELMDLLERHLTMSTDAIVVAAVQDHPAGLDQQLVLLERCGHNWSTTDLFRVMCEPMVRVAR
jgi:protein-L-isoaspartate O-methyltransferase